MGRIRPLATDDIPSIVHLYEMIYGRGVGTSSQGFREYLSRVFLHSPWADPELPSLVYQEEGGEIVGFIGVIPRRMVFQERPIRVAVSTSFMVHPDWRRTLAGVLLQKAFFSGPQDLSLTDGANDASRIVWEKLGGIAAPLYGLWWTRVLRPAQFALNVVKRKREYLSPFFTAVKPVSWVIDEGMSWLKPNDFDKQLGNTSSHDLDVEPLLDSIRKFSKGDALYPSYDLHTLSWFLNIACEKQQYGPLRKSVVRNEQGEIIGWFLYYLKPSGTGHVLQFMSAKESVHHVLSHLFLDARRAGASAITGRIEPRFVSQFSEAYCYFQAGTWMLLHAVDHDLLHAICRGEAFLSGLEGERWTRFLEFVE